MCSPSATPAGAASRRLTEYVPAVATFTVYLNHCPVPVQPMLYPAPVPVVSCVSALASRSTPSER